MQSLSTDWPSYRPRLSGFPVVRRPDGVDKHGDVKKAPSVEGAFLNPSLLQGPAPARGGRWGMPTASTVTGRAANRADGALSTVLSGEWDPVVQLVLTIQMLLAAQTPWRQIGGYGPALSASPVSGFCLGVLHTLLFVIGVVFS